jgi:hypothetical protein
VRCETYVLSVKLRRQFDFQGLTQNLSLKLSKVILRVIPKGRSGIFFALSAFENL